MFAASRRLALAASLAALLACGAPELREPVALSLLALGDTGARPGSAPRLATQRAVGAALAAEDRRQPVAALVLLGDLFYPKGLHADELVERVGLNLVRPYCRFVALDAPRSAEVASACELPAAERRPVPIYAVPGNHDYDTPGSPQRERESVPLFLSNWRMPAQQAAVAELGHGVSLVLFDSSPVLEGGAPAELASALRAARGPWRIVAAHHPIAVQGDARREEYTGMRNFVLAEIAAAGVPVQLYLAGHEHNLQVLEMAPPAPPLHVISGGGKGGRKLDEPEPNRRAGFESAGYARIDLAGTGERERLVVTLIRVPPRTVRWLVPTRFGARFSVDRGGRVSEE